MYVVDRKTMTRAEELSVKRGKEWFELMQNAGRAAAAFIAGENDLAGKAVLILCGKGNNGGDGFVIARELSLLGAIVTVVLLQGDPVTDSAKKAFAALPPSVCVTDRVDGQKRFHITVDAVLGTGANGEAFPALSALRTVIPAFSYAIDLPSGIACDTGRGAEWVIPAHTTLTFAALKLCHVLPQSSSLCGRVVTLDIGITESDLADSGAEITVIDRPIFSKRNKNDFKNRFGTLLSVCGSFGMSGASIIAGKAALRSGVGILMEACIEENYTACAVSLPEAVLLPVKSQGKTYGIWALEPLKAALSRVDALLVGCGFGISAEGKTVVKELLKATRVPTVLDADGINSVADDINFLKEVKAPLVLTPHPGEMARLLACTPAEVESDRIRLARRFAAEYKVYLVLKGSNTVVATPDGDISVCIRGNAGMATAGSGDMLAGIIAALLAKGTFDPAAAVKAAVWLHSAAGDAARDDLGEEAMLPSDMIDRLHRFL